jgi:putative ABC transport system permease protein
VTRKIHQLEPSRSVFEVMPLSEHLSEYNAENRFRTLLLTLFALTAISLASIGLYATLSYLIARRRREIGLRMAMGALPGQIFTLFLLQGTLVSLAGCLAGLDRSVRRVLSAVARS